MKELFCTLQNDLIYAFGPLFHDGEGSSRQGILFKLRTTSMVVFAQKYPPLEYLENQIEIVPEEKSVALAMVF